MSSRVVKLNDFAKVIAEHTDKSVAEFRRATVAGIQKSIPDLVAGSPVDTGLYASSWEMTEDEVSVTIGNTAPYAGIIEDGARPFTPPLAPLLAWAKRVTGDGSQPPHYSPKVQAIARAVQQKIAREGMKPRHVLQNAIPGIIENIRRELENGT